MALTLDQAQTLGRPDLAKQTAKNANSAAEMGDRFLTLLVTQMRNQDPLNPMENSQVTTQLAQISTVTGVDKLNSSIEAMSKSMSTSQTFQAASLVGRGVLAAGKVLDLHNSVAIGAVDLKEAATKVNIEVFDDKKKSVAKIEMDSVPAGVSEFVWDGKVTKDSKEPPLKDGAYTFAITATNGGKAVDTAPLAVTRVDSVTLGGAEVMLNTNTLGTFAMSGIKQIF